MSVSNKKLPQSPEEKSKMLGEYLLEEGRKMHSAVEKQVTRRAWRVFEDAIENGGSFSPSDYERFGFNSMMAFRPSVKELEDVHLVTSVREESDKRRKSVVVVPKGFLVSHFRKQSGLTKPSSQTSEVLGNHR